ELELNARFRLNAPGEVVRRPEEAQERALHPGAKVLPTIRPYGHDLIGERASAGRGFDPADGDQLLRSEDEAILVRVPIGAIVIGWNASVDLTCNKGRAGEAPTVTGEPQPAARRIHEAQIRLRCSAGPGHVEREIERGDARRQLRAEAVAHPVGAGGSAR